MSQIYPISNDHDNEQDEDDDDDDDCVDFKLNKKLVQSISNRNTTNRSFANRLVSGLKNVKNTFLKSGMAKSSSDKDITRNTETTVYFNRKSKPEAEYALTSSSDSLEDVLMASKLRMQREQAEENAGHYDKDIWSSTESLEDIILATNIRNRRERRNQTQPESNASILPISKMQVGSINYSTSFNESGCKTNKMSTQIDYDDGASFTFNSELKRIGNSYSAIEQ